MNAAVQDTSMAADRDALANAAFRVAAAAAALQAGRATSFERAEAEYVREQGRFETELERVTGLPAHVIADLVQVPGPGRPYLTAHDLAEATGDFGAIGLPHRAAPKVGMACPATRTITITPLWVAKGFAGAAVASAIIALIMAVTP